MTNYVLFSIDNVTNTHTLAKFLRHMDTQIVLCKTEGYLVQCIGYYKGRMETSFILNEKDYVDHVLPLEFTEDQECVFWTTGPEALTYSCPFDLDGGDLIGVLKQTTKKKALKSDGFTYRPDLNAYWVIK